MQCAQTKGTPRSCDHADGDSAALCQLNAGLECLILGSDSAGLSRLCGLFGLATANAEG